MNVAAIFRRKRKRCARQASRGTQIRRTVLRAKNGGENSGTGSPDVAGVLQPLEFCSEDSAVPSGRGVLTTLATVAGLSGACRAQQGCRSPHGIDDGVNLSATSAASTACIRGQQACFFADSVEPCAALLVIARAAVANPLAHASELNMITAMIFRFISHACLTVQPDMRVFRRTVILITTGRERTISTRNQIFQRASQTQE